MSTIASRKSLGPRFSVYQLGRGREPVIAVGSSFPAVAVNNPSSDGDVEPGCASAPCSRRPAATIQDAFTVKQDGTLLPVSVPGSAPGRRIPGHSVQRCGTPRVTFVPVRLIA